jgi:hypothetical protein
MHEKSWECQALREVAAPIDCATLLGLRCHTRSDCTTSSGCTGPLRFERLMHTPLDSTLRARARTVSDLLRHAPLTPSVSREAIAEQVVSRLERNVLSVGNHRGLAGSALFRGIAMLNHSCDPNAFVWFCFGETEGRVVAEIRASRVIQPGDEICIDVRPRVGSILLYGPLYTVQCSPGLHADMYVAAMLWHACAVLRRIVANELARAARGAATAIHVLVQLCAVCSGSTR